MTPVLLRAIGALAVVGMAGCQAPGGADRPGRSGGRYDVVIRNAKIVDGTGNPWYEGDVGIRRDRIAVIAPKGGLSSAQAGTIVDAKGLVLSPGFIDIQAHSWNQLLFGDGRIVGKISQGVTSEILGEATTPGPSNSNVDSLYSGREAEQTAMLPHVPGFRGRHGFGTWLAAMERHGIAPNAGSYLGAPRSAPTRWPSGRGLLTPRSSTPCGRS